MRTPQGIHRLSATAVTNIKEPGWHCDGGGLYLEVDKTGRKRWAMRLTVDGKRRDFGLGPLHKVSLKDAREMAADFRAKAYRGIDPIAEKRARRAAIKAVKAAKAVPTFEVCAKRVHDQRRKQWSNGKHVDQWINTLYDHAFPKIGKKPVDQIVTADVLAVLEPIWTTKPETARRVRQRLYTVLDWARAAGHRSGDNPVDLIGDALAKHKRRVQHHTALPYTEVPAFVRALRDGHADPITKLAFEFLILTAARTSEVRFARWDEIDEGLSLWTIPGMDEITGRRMKAEREHVVPLAPRVAEILKQARELAGDNELIFPDRETGRPMSENRFLLARDSLGFRERCTPHGFRSSFRDWTSEETDFPSEVAEMALAHTIKNKTEAAYRRGHLLAKRRELMNAWALYAAPQ